MKILALTLTLTLFLFISCKKAEEQQEVAQEPQTQKTSPYKIKLSPPGATKNNSISVYLKGANQKDLGYRWFVNNAEIKDAKGAVLKYPEFKKHDEVRVKVSIKGYGEFLSDPLIIADISPKIQSAKLFPLNPRRRNDLYVETKTFDGDGDVVTIDYEWFINGDPVSASMLDTPGTLSGALIKRGDKVSVKITPSDGENNGRTITLNTLVANSSPVVSKEIETMFDGSIYSTKISAIDPDGDTIAYTLKQGPGGMAINPASGVITWNVRPEDTGRQDVIVSVSDNNGGEVIVPFTTTIGIGE